MPDDQPKTFELGPTDRVGGALAFGLAADTVERRQTRPRRD